jgi:hypothetical protein
VRFASFAVVSCAVVLSAGSERAAFGDDPKPARPPSTPPTAIVSVPEVVPAPVVVPTRSMYGTTDGADTREGLDPIPSRGIYVAYGLSVDSEALLTPGNLCPNGTQGASCVLGNGAGIALRVARRTDESSLGAVFSVTFHSSDNIYQRGILDQLGGEYRVRPRFAAFRDTIAGFVGVGAGLAAYGDDWAIATVGASGSAMVGAEFEVSVKLAVIVDVTYRAIYFRGFTDESAVTREAGLAQLLGFELGLELRDPL